MQQDLFRTKTKHCIVEKAVPFCILSRGNHYNLYGRVRTHFIKDVGKLCLFLRQVICCSDIHHLFPSRSQSFNVLQCQHERFAERIIKHNPIFDRLIFYRRRFEKFTPNACRQILQLVISINPIELLGEGHTFLNISPRSLIRSFGIRFLSQMLDSLVSLFDISD